jgi:acetyl-CoA C-acetyltransferase
MEAALHDVYILSAVRTPIGKFGGSLASMTAADMGVVAAQAAMERAAVRPDQIEETIFGNARQAGGGPNVARQISVRSGVPQEVPAYAVNKACASGLKSIALGFQEIATGNFDCILAGGTESMSRLPYYLDGARWGYRLGNQELVDGMYRDGFFCPLAKMLMGETAEVLAEQYKITREEQDEYAVNSHRKALSAIKECRFKDQIVPVELPSKKKGAPPQFFTVDESPREDTSVETLRALKPAFKKDGTVTAGNAPGVNDGASALVLMSAAKAKELGLKPMARIVAQASSGLDPAWVMMTPVETVRQLWKKTGWKNEDVDLYEINEAFSVAAIAVTRELGIDLNKVNVNGGAVALGHPIGSSGARILTTLVYEMIRRDVHKGVAALCLGGGNAVGLAIER